jgi:flagellar hook-length control protein FliK
MDTGQMMAVMQYMPASTAATLPAGETAVKVEPLGGGFAGLLQGKSIQKTAQAMVAEQSGLQGMTVSGQAMLAVPGMMNDPMAALVATAGSTEKQALPVQADSPATESNQSTRVESDSPVSQNVTLDLNAAQLAVLFGQLQGRMPAVEPAATANQTEGTCVIPQMGQAATESLNSNVSSQIRMETPNQQAAAAATAVMAAAKMATPTTASNPKDVLMANGAAAVPFKMPVMATLVAEKEPQVTSISGSKVAAAPQNEVAVTEGGKQAAAKVAEIARPTETLPRVSVEQDASQAEVVFIPARDSLQVVSGSQRQQDSLVMHSQQHLFVEEPHPTVVASPQQPVVEMHDLTGTGSQEPQPEQPAVHSRVATLSATTMDSQPLQVKTQDVELPEVQMPVQQEQIQKVRSAAPTVIPPAAATVATAEGKPDTVAVRSDQRETVKISQDGQVNAAKVVAVTSGEKQASSEENETPDRGMNGNFTSQVFHHTVKTEGVVTSSATSGVVPNVASRVDASPEQVVQQVKERFVTHETKPGSEQIVLRLSPENLGELKVNLNLEGQRLKVEIVAENKMVRDSLMQHTDALKESLSRQNIKMESFEVTTGGNGTTDSGRGQGGWRELAQQRQQNAWMPDGGYRLAQQAAPAVAAYQAKSEHTMVDLHY